MGKHAFMHTHTNTYIQPVYTHRHTHTHNHGHTEIRTSKPQSGEVVLESGGTDYITMVLDTGNDFCQNHLYCNYNMLIMYFIK